MSTNTSVSLDTLSDSELNYLVCDILAEVTRRRNDPVGALTLSVRAGVIPLEKLYKAAALVERELRLERQAKNREDTEIK